MKKVWIKLKACLDLRNMEICKDWNVEDYLKTNERKKIPFLIRKWFDGLRKILIDTFDELFQINTLKYTNLSNDKIPMQKRTVIGTHKTKFKGLLYDRHPQVRQSIRNSKRV